MKNVFGKKMVLVALLMGAFAVAPMVANAQGPAPQKMGEAQCHGPKGRPGPGFDRHAPRGPGHRFERPMPPRHPAPMPPPPGPRFVRCLPVAPPPCGYVWQPCVGGWALVNIGPVVIGLGW